MRDKPFAPPCGYSFLLSVDDNNVDNNKNEKNTNKSKSNSNNNNNDNR